jgi:hypothetical protein
MKNFKTLFPILSGLVISTVVGVSAFSANVDASVNHSNPTDFHIIVDGGAVKDLTVQGMNENVTSQGVYYVTYRFSYPSRDGEIRFPLKTEAHRCDGGNGNTSGPYAGIACVDPQVYIDNRQVALDSSNNYTQDITFSVSQPSQKVCGAFQTDVFASSIQPQFVTGSFYKTGVDCNQPTPTPTVTPTPTPSASTIQCPVGKISKVVDSTIICISQNQEQTQTQTQNNNQNQTVNQNVTATGGSSSSSSSSSSNVNLTVNNPTNTVTNNTVREVVAVTNPTTPQVVMQTKGDVTELPRTGLPLAALALAGLAPAGFGLKKFAKKSTEEVSANSIWTEKQLNS